MVKKLTLSLILGAALSLSACASTQGDGATAADAVTVRVENNLLPPTTLTVYAVPDAGIRDLLGQVRPNETASFTVDGVLAGQYRFVAETTEGREIVSNPIALGVNDAVFWDVDANLVTPM